MDTRWLCLPCIIERKVAEQRGTEEAELPKMRRSVTLLNGQPHCYEHISVGVQSPLMVPNGTPPMPQQPALVRP